MSVPTPTSFYNHRVIDTAIIVAGGLGTRLRPLTELKPKPLLPIQGKPILEHIIESFKYHSIVNIIISIGYKAELVQEYFGDGSQFGVSITYVIETELLGTGGAVKLASQKLINANPFFLVWGDNLMDINWTLMRKEFISHSFTPSAFTPSVPSMIMALTPRDDVEHFGVAELKDNKIIKFVEKPSRELAPSNLINAGAFIIDPACLSILPEGVSSIERECFSMLASQGLIISHIHSGQWFPTDTMEKYLYANSSFEPIQNEEIQSFLN